MRKNKIKSKIIFSSILAVLLVLFSSGMINAQGGRSHQITGHCCDATKCYPEGRNVMTFQT
jgi:hypothetical protein